MGSIATEDEEMAMEVRDASPRHYLLKIESFSLLSESGIDKFESNEFEAGGHKWDKLIPCLLEALVVSKGQWKQTVRDICDISIFLKSVDAKDFDHHQKVKANCSINLKDQIIKWWMQRAIL
ncbi:hypothetical protein H5410_037950 [Solanum commersonii]|uniref:Uncharacterized protein n=1 Tax=Solanum commersonii TaxID=4109 RepID=A0A9J5YCK6_SOLCO|nr:hypothetical protein H5410_037950 [Solanum commersonii]